MVDITFSKDYWERVLRSFYTSALAVAGPLVFLHLIMGIADGKIQDWHALKSAALVVIAAGVNAGFTAVKGMIAKGLGYNPDNASLKGAANGNGS